MGFESTSHNTIIPLVDSLEVYKYQASLFRREIHDARINIRERCPAYNQGLEDVRKLHGTIRRLESSKGSSVIDIAHRKLPHLRLVEHVTNKRLSRLRGEIFAYAKVLAALRGYEPIVRKRLKHIGRIAALAHPQ